MAKYESLINEDEAFTNTVEILYRKSREYVGAKRPVEWAIGAGAYLDLAQRVSYLEVAMKQGVLPTIQNIMKTLERYDQRDTLPGAASAAYEWHSQLTAITDTIENMLKIFDDLDKRLSCYVNLIQQVKELLKLARSVGNRNVRDAVLTLYDALHGVYSEDLVITQAEVVKSAIAHLYNLNLDREQVRALHRQLRKSGFETVPSDRFVGMYRE